MRSRLIRTLIVIAGVVLALALLRTADSGASQPGQPPFRNPVEQREQMIQELQEIKSLLREQNALLRDALGRKSPLSNDRQP
jgi:hypothetical protein